MDKLERKIKSSLDKKPSKQYYQMIQNTMEKIGSGEINQEKRDNILEFKTPKKKKGLRFIQSVAAVLVIGMLSVTVYAGVTGRLDINIGKTGHKKIDKNYNEVATAVNKSIENEYFIFTLESMAADPAYLIFEYDLKFKDKTMNEIGEIPYNDIEGYGIWINQETWINNKRKDYAAGRNLRTVQKISENDFKIVEIICIADMREDILNVKKKITNIEIRDVSKFESLILNVDVAQNLSMDVKFENKKQEILAQEKLSNGSTLYIEKVENSKFENFVLARIITEPKEYGNMYNRENEFMIEDTQYALCDQNGETINFDNIRLEEYYEKVLPDGSIEEASNLESTDIVRMQQVQLLKLAIDEENSPEKIKVLPLNRKLYNDRNMSEYEFYQNEDWYQVKVGEAGIQETSQVGGNVTITKIEELDDRIIFYYDTEGFVPSYIDMVIRFKNKKMNYKYPRYEEFKGIDGDDNKIVFTKDLRMLAGMYLPGQEDIENIDDLEFAMFYNVKYDVLSEELEFEWNKTENSDIATIENVNFSQFVNSINEKLLDQSHIIQDWRGVITKLDEDNLKFYSKFDKKDLILEDPDSFLYYNGRTMENMKFEEIKEGDYIWTLNYGQNCQRNNDRIMVIRKLEGEELKQELIKQMSVNSPTFIPEFDYREAKNIEIINKEKAILTFEFSDLYQDVLQNDEKFEMKIEINPETTIYRDDLWAGGLFTINDLKTIEYVPTRVSVELVPETIEDEIPKAYRVDMGWLDIEE